MKKILFLSLLFANSLFASVSVSHVNALIKAQNLKWLAKENTLSKLPDAAMKRLMGSLLKGDGDVLFEARTLTRDSIDWRNAGGVNWLGPVMNQGNCGSCVSFASIATLEAQYRITSGLPWLSPTFSQQQLFACGGGGCDRGWYPGSAVSTLIKNGVPDYACLPYASGSTGLDVSCKENFCDNQEQRTYKVSNSVIPSSWGGSAQKVKAALKNGPLITTMTVYEDFLTYSQGIYKSVSSKSLGGHAISLVGFNDEGRYWIIRNSWGKDWGENGFARISYDDKSGIANNTYGLILKKEAQYISVQYPQDHSYVSGEVTLNVQSIEDSSSKVTINSPNDSMEFECSSKNCALPFDTTKLKDGRYEIVAKDKSGNSQVREFFILNHDPKTAISFTGIEGVDLTKPLKERIEFYIDVLFDSAPPQMVSFIVENMKGEVVFQRDTDLVLERMKLGFRTNAVPNGEYLIYYKAQTPYLSQMSTVYSNKIKISIAN